MERSLSIFIVLCTVLAVGYLLQKNRGVFRKLNPKDSQSEFNKLLNVDELGTVGTLVQFSTAFCSSCRSNKLMLNELVKKYPGMKFKELDAESNLAAINKLNVTATPTVFLLNETGKSVGKFSGPIKKEQAKLAVESLIQNTL
jgi:thioredoxin-like negative regulator of GroEL